MVSKIRLGYRTLALAGALAVTLSACGSSTSPSSTSSTGAPLNLTLALPATEIDITPLLAGVAGLKSQGINVTVKAFESVTGAEQAFVANRADMLFGSTEGMLSANAKGADARAVWQGEGDNWVLMSSSSVTNVSQLSGKPLATGPSGQTTYTLVTEGAKKLGFSPNLVVINGSDNRAQALAQGQVASAVGSVTDFLNLNFQKPGQFRVIVSYAKVFPGFSDGYIWMHQSFLTKHPSQAQTIVNALAKSYKRVNTDEAWFVQQGKIYAPTLPTSAAQAIWQAFVADKLWAEDGALKVSECQSRLDFLSKYGYVTSPAPVSKWCMSAMAQTAVAAAG